MKGKFTFSHLMNERHHTHLQHSFLTTPHPLGRFSHGLFLINKLTCLKDAAQWRNKKETSRNGYHLFSFIHVGAIATVRFSLSGAGRKKSERENRHGNGWCLKNEAMGSAFHALLTLTEWNCSVVLIRLIILNL